MRCADCKKDKAPEDFPRSRRNKSGRGSYCKPCHNRRNREFVQRRHGGSRHYHLMQKYGISAAEAEVLKSSQGGLCPICKERPAVHVDHDHDTGKVRAILCEPCNGFLGAFKDNKELLRAAILYVETQR